MIKRFNYSYEPDPKGQRYTSVLGHPDEAYAYLVMNRFAMYSGRDAFVQEIIFKGLVYPSQKGYRVWVSLHDSEHSSKDLEASLDILQKDKQHSGPKWDKYYSSKRQHNEMNY